MFILASSVCKSLQRLISALTQGAKGGHFRLTCSVVLWGGRDTANKYYWHVWGVLAVNGLHLGLPQPNVACTSQVLVIHVLKYSTKAQTQLGVHFVPFPDPSISDDQVLGVCIIPGGPCVLITYPVPATWFARCATKALSQLCHVSPLGS